MNSDQEKIEQLQKTVDELRKERRRLKEALVTYIVHGKIHGHARAEVIAETTAKGETLT